MPARHVVLVGLPGSGKTTVGQLAASRLNAPFIDLDRLIEARTGRSVERIFAEEGEAAFRDLEADTAESVLQGPPGVFAPGGGYFQNVMQRESALSHGYVIYLQTLPSIAARRLEGQPQRPLLRGFEPTLRLAQLLHQRESAYLQATAKVSTDSLTPEQVADRVVVLARSDGGW